MKKFNRILLVNDDGYSADGMKILAEVAHQLGNEVWIVAPLSDRSGASNSFSFKEPVRYEKIHERCFAILGTPSDCVAIALEHLLKETPPDLILSGINSGSNLGFESVLSGTVGAAMTGMLSGIRSVALSQYKLMDEQPDWTVASEMCLSTLETVLSWPAPKESCLNINFPNCNLSELKGIKVGVQSIGKVGGINVTEVKDPIGDSFFWLRVRHSRDDLINNSELNIVLDGHISVTPLALDRTHHDEKCQLTFYNR
jgi:5'-nucleotidase